MYWPNRMAGYGVMYIANHSRWKSFAVFVD